MIKKKMSSYNASGSLLETLNTGEFIWFINLPDEVLEGCRCIRSPTFSYSHGSWFIKMLRMRSNGTDYISLYLRVNKTQSEIYVECSAEMIFQGKKLDEENCNYTFEICEMDHGWPQYVLRNVILDQWSNEPEVCGRLIIIIRLRDKVPVKDNKLLQKRKEGKKILCQNIKDLLHHEKCHDLILRVKDREFKVHQNIMQCRCPVFKTMLNHDMMEKNRGIVEIHDCEPLAFEQFIFYIYSGELETLDESFIIGLYYIADKYGIACVKEMCCEFLKKSLSPRNVCDVIKLALNHSDSSLLECGKKYYIDNVKNVLVTAEWQSFLKENPIQANELIISAFDHFIPQEKTETKIKRQKSF